MLVKCSHCQNMIAIARREAGKIYVCSGCQRSGALGPGESMAKHIKSQDISGLASGQQQAPQGFMFEIQLSCSNCGQAAGRWLHVFEVTAAHPLDLMPCVFCGTFRYTGTLHIRRVYLSDLENAKGRAQTFIENAKALK